MKKNIKKMIRMERYKREIAYYVLAIEFSIVLASTFFIYKDKGETPIKTNYEETIENNEGLFKNLYTKYDVYIKLIAKGIKEAGMDTNIMDTFAYYNFALNNGYFSLGDKFVYKINGKFEPVGNLGVQIVNGTGCCRNESFHLNDVLKELGYESGLVVGSLYDGAIPPSLPNHEVVYVKDDNKIYLLDPTNQDIFLRNIYGNWESIHFENSHFNPAITSDTMQGPQTTSTDILYYMRDDFSNYITYKTRYSNSLLKSIENTFDFEEYENTYLRALEESMDKDMDEYLELFKIFQSNNILMKR